MLPGPVETETDPNICRKSTLDVNINGDLLKYFIVIRAGILVGSKIHYLFLLLAICVQCDAYTSGQEVIRSIIPTISNAKWLTAKRKKYWRG